MTVTPEAVVISAPQKIAPHQPVKAVDKVATQAVVKPSATKDAKAAAKPVVSAPKAAPKVASTVATKATTKVASKVTTKAVAKGAPKVAPKVVATAVASSKVEKPAKPKKPKLVRDSFTIPKTEYVVLEELKLRAIKLASPIKKTELIRAGIKALAAMSDTALLAALKAVPAIKTGRPAKS